MDFLKLTYFMAVAKHEHITKAANEISISQPALSRVIAQIEDELGVKLFDRGGRQLHLNQCGQVFLEFCTRTTLNFKDTVAQIHEISSGEGGHVSVAVPFPYREPDWLDHFTRRFVKTHPDVSFLLNNMSVEKAKETLYTRETDIAMSDVPIIGRNILWRELFTESIGVLLAADHPLAQKNILCMEDLRDERFLCNNTSSLNHDYTISLCSMAGYTPNIVFRGTFPDIIGELVSKGAGVALMHEGGFKGYTNLHYEWSYNLVFRPLSDDYCTRTFGLATLGDRILPKAAQDFYDDVCSVDIPSLRQKITIDWRFGKQTASADE